MSLSTVSLNHAPSPPLLPILPATLLVESPATGQKDKQLEDKLSVLRRQLVYIVTSTRCFQVHYQQLIHPTIAHVPCSISRTSHVLDWPILSRSTSSYLGGLSSPNTSSQTYLPSRHHMLPCGQRLPTASTPERCLVGLFAASARTFACHTGNL